MQCSNVARRKMTQDQGNTQCASDIRPILNASYSFCLLSLPIPLHHSLISINSSLSFIQFHLLSWTITLPQREHLPGIPSLSPDQPRVVLDYLKSPQQSLLHCPVYFPSQHLARQPLIYIYILYNTYIIYISSLIICLLCQNENSRIGCLFSLFTAIPSTQQDI